MYNYILLMKSKSQILLYIFETILTKKSINMNSVVAEFNILERTFRRYIADINAYFCNQYKNYSIVYQRKINMYCLVVD